MFRSLIIAYIGYIGIVEGVFRDPDFDKTITFEEIQDTSERSGTSVENLVLGSIDPKIDRCQDFYQYACGGHLNNNKKGLIYTASIDLYKTVLPLVRDNPVTLGFFQSCQNLINAEPTVSVKIKNTITAIEEAKSVSQVMKLLGNAAKVTPINPFLHNIQLFPMLRDGSRNGALYFDFGIEGDEESESLALKILEKDHLLDSNELDSVLAEIQQLPIVKVKRSKEKFEQDEDKEIEDKKITVESLVSTFPIAIGPMLKQFFNGRKLNELIVDSRIELLSMARMEMYLASAKLSSIINVAKYSIARSVAALYPTFKSEEAGPVAMTCLRKTMEVLSDVVGKDYMDKVLTKKVETTTRSMIDNIIKEAKILLKDRNSTLDEATRNDFGEKINNVNVHIGGQKKVGDYKKRDFAGSTYLTNLIEISRINNQKIVDSIGKKIDAFDIIEAAQVNAFYHPLYNDLFIPAGILQAPMFGTEYPVAMQHSVIGYVLAHELTHSIDPKCIRVNRYGEMRENWYTSPEAKAVLDKNIQCYVDEYSKFQVIGTEGQLIGNVNGKKTVGENVADSGLQLAYAAFKKTGNNQGLGGFTADQLFFLTSAQVWCNSVSDEAAAAQLIRDVHSPSKARVNGVLMHNSVFAKAFKCPVGSPMNPEKKCNWWGKP